MINIYGNFVEPFDGREYLIISFSSKTLSLQDRWRNNSISADFLADYWGTFFPARQNATTPDKAQTRPEMRDTVSYIANELLENAIKFSYETVDVPIRIGIYLTNSLLRFYVTNSLNPHTLPAFQAYINGLLTEDPSELYFRQLEHNATKEDTSESRLGLLTLLNDYQATLAWKFEQDDQTPEKVTVTTMVDLAIVRPPLNS